ncbi:LegK7 family Dot/Icm T4SS effector kinase [Legionella worsleiensis]|uniref:Protein kinase domain containing protein n=1 Tax=Legionella worsleiensis TaxID=45076 RepID=A0A0W1A713_9GAMM|nr:LegK7 family Dot/Icm T4SS effector kinase [Legionella worsleiensis]KTD76819.1 protein kinase domain containing protein [Legionella worsleiensis]STY30680.1 protein kinase domain containing protein [Legionella worsleiensis]
MPMLAPPKPFSSLIELVNTFNQLPEKEDIQKLFYLQKINYHLNTLIPDKRLYTWMTDSSANGFEEHLKRYSITPHASFFLKGIQFAQAVARYSSQKAEKKTYSPYIIYPLMQKRDDYLINNSFAEAGNDYISLSLDLTRLAATEPVIKSKVEKQIILSEMVSSKIQAIRNKTDSINHLSHKLRYKTEPLGAGGNNANFKFTISGLEGEKGEEELALRVEDRSDLSLEQRLHSHDVSMYFIEDYALFINGFQNENSPIEYNPVAISDLAKQGNLVEVALKLRNKSAQDIAAYAQFYFDQIINFLSLLLDAKAYHPDMKLSNFLADKNRLLISDRKTFIDNRYPLVSTVRSSPNYAPDEYNNCLDFLTNRIKFNKKANTTTLDMPQFMAYQLGMILKEFLLLTQMDELPEDFRDKDISAASYFCSPTNAIINMSLLIQELTRTNPENRMTIDQFKDLFVLKNMSPDNFYAQVEQKFPSEQLGIQEDIAPITALINEKNISVLQRFASIFKNLFSLNPKPDDYLLRTNEQFKKISSLEPRDTRITYMAEKLATTCYKEYSHAYFKKCSLSLESVLFEQDWHKASWYRKALHWLTFGLYGIDRTTDVDMASVTIHQDLKSDEFQTHFAVLQFLPPRELNNLGLLESARFKDFLFAHIQEIVPEALDDSEYSDSSSSDSDLNSKPVPLLNEQSIHQDKASLEQVDSLPSGTMVIKSSQSLEKDAAADALPSATMVIKDDTPEELSTDTVVFRPSAQAKKMSFSFIAAPGFFSNPGSKEAKKEKVASIKSALLRGDFHCNSRMGKKTRPSIQNFIWEPVTPETNDTPLTSNCPQENQSRMR